MAAIMTTVAAITKMVRGRMETFPLDAIFGKPTLYSVQHLVKQLEKFASHFATTKWGGKHRFLPLVLSEANIRQATGNNNLDYERLNKPELINPRIEDITQGQELLQLQEDQKIKCKEYTFQEAV